MAVRSTLGVKGVGDLGDITTSYIALWPNFVWVVRDFGGVAYGEQAGSESSALQPVRLVKPFPS